MNSDWKWTEERTAELKRRWAGESATVIATSMGTTRNTIIGKAHRLGLMRKVPPLAGPKVPKIRKPYEPHPKVNGSAAPVLGPASEPGEWRGNPMPTDLPARPFLEEAARADSLEGPWTPIKPEAPAEGLTLVELRLESCRWPKGNPLLESFRFCGQPTDRPPYCEAHRKVAYVPNIKKARLAPKS